MNSGYQERYTSSKLRDWSRLDPFVPSDSRRHQVILPVSRDTFRVFNFYDLQADIQVRKKESTSSLCHSENLFPVNPNYVHYSLIHTSPL